MSKGAFEGAFAFVKNNNSENEEVSAAYRAPGHSLPARYAPSSPTTRARNNIPTLEEELRRTSSPFHNMIRRQHAELNAIRARIQARVVSPNALNYARRSHMEEREHRMMRSPLPPAPPPPPPERHIPLHEMTREQLMEKHRRSLAYATREGSPEFIEFTKEMQMKELGRWEAAQVGRPPAAAAAPPAAAAAAPPRSPAFAHFYNNNNNNINDAEIAFGELGPLNRNRNYYPLTGIRVEKRRERNTRKQRKTRRSKSRRYARR